MEMFLNTGFPLCFPSRGQAETHSVDPPYQRDCFLVSTCWGTRYPKGGQRRCEGNGAIVSPLSLEFASGSACLPGLKNIPLLEWTLSLFCPFSSIGGISRFQTSTHLGFWAESCSKSIALLIANPLFHQGRDIQCLWPLIALSHLPRHSISIRYKLNAQTEGMSTLQSAWALPGFQLQLYTEKLLT